MINVFDTGHIHSATVCGAFAEGIGAAVVRPPWPDPQEPIFVYGKLRGTLDAVAAARAAGVDWYMADNGYIGAGHYSGFYRVTRNAMQLGHPAPGCAADPARVAALNIWIKPWRKGGREILVCPPMAKYNQVMAFAGEGWLEDTLCVLARATDRPVRVSRKPGEKRADLLNGAPTARRSLAENLAGAFALVTHDSNVAVEAVLAGVPVFVTGDSPARFVGLADPARIETPSYPERRNHWLAWLAANQWTLAELRAGVCWRKLQALELAA